MIGIIRNFSFRFGLDLSLSTSISLHCSVQYIIKLISRTQIQSAYGRLGKRELALDVLTVACTSALHMATFETVRAFASAADASSGSGSLAAPSPAAVTSAASASGAITTGAGARGGVRPRARRQQLHHALGAVGDGERRASTSGGGLSGPSLQQFSDICKASRLFCLAFVSSCLLT